MLYAVIGKKYAWFFSAPDKTEGRKRANTILFFEKTGATHIVSGFNLQEGYWQAIPRKLDDDIKSLIEKIDETKIIKIKRRRNLTIDVLYITRLQKERL